MLFLLKKGSAKYPYLRLHFYCSRVQVRDSLFSFPMSVMHPLFPGWGLQPRQQQSPAILPHGAALKSASSGFQALANPLSQFLGEIIEHMKAQRPTELHKDKALLSLH